MGSFCNQMQNCLFFALCPIISCMKNVISLTGPMAAGKNLAAKILEEMGFAVIDADLVAHQALDIVKNQVFDAFKTHAQKQNLNLQNTDGSINRKALAQIVFGDPQKLKQHESIIHPQIQKMLVSFVESNKDKTCVLNATVLYKTPIINQCKLIIYIDAPLLVRLHRARKRDKHSIWHILQRFASQKNLYAQYQKINVDICRVYNFGTEQKLKKKLIKVLKEY